MDKHELSVEKGIDNTNLKQFRGLLVDFRNHRDDWHLTNDEKQALNIIIEKVAKLQEEWYKE